MLFLLSFFSISLCPLFFFSRDSKIEINVKKESTRRKLQFNKFYSKTTINQVSDAQRQSKTIPDPGEHKINHGQSLCTASSKTYPSSSFLYLPPLPSIGSLLSQDIIQFPSTRPSHTYSSIYLSPIS